MYSPLIFNNNKIALNSLILQPFWECKNNCAECYLKKAHNNSTDKISKWWLHLDLFKEAFINRDKINVNQITISFNSGLGEMGVSFWKELIDIMDCPIDDNQPELYFTFNTLNDYEEYKNINSKKSEEIFKHIDMISLSKISMSDLEKIKSINKINWNFIPDLNNNAEDYFKEIHRILSKINSCYLLYLKRPLGEQQNKEQMKALIYFYLKLKNYLPNYLFDKITLDNCINNSIKYISTGFGCSANASQLHIWPNGACSGCPYNSCKDVNGRDSVDEILNEMKNCTKNYDFNRCLIKECL